MPVPAALKIVLNLILIPQIALMGRVPYPRLQRRTGA